MDESLRVDPPPLVSDPDRLRDLSVDPPRGVAAPPTRGLAALQILSVCGLPTQFLIAGILIVVAGMPPVTSEGVTLEFIATVSFLDTALVALLIRLFLSASGETSRDVYLGSRPVGGEIALGVALVPLVFAVVVGLVMGVRAIAPWLHTVEKSPLEAFMRTPFDAAIFLVVVVLAGGVREELQRGFILHRFGQRFGGVWVGNLIFGVAFGLGHYDQGWDIVLVIGALGFGWGLLYMRRRSVVASMVNHAGFNAAQVLQQVLATSLGWGR